VINEKVKLEMKCEWSRIAREVFTGFWLGNPKERGHLEDLDVGGRMTLRWTVRS